MVTEFKNRFGPPNWCDPQSLEGGRGDPPQRVAFRTGRWDGGLQKLQDLTGAATLNEPAKKAAVAEMAREELVTHSKL